MGEGYNSIVRFGDVPNNTFDSNGAQNGAAGNQVRYPHTFVAGTAGQVTFSTTNVTVPTSSGWVNTIYRDADCDGVLSTTEAATALTGAIAVTAGQQICIVVRESIPATAALGAVDDISVNANFIFANTVTVPAVTYTRHDITTVSLVGNASLTLVKSVDRATALPTDPLIYTLTYTNTSSAPLTNVVVQDATPTFTLYVGGSAGCPNLTARVTCTVTAEPANGATGLVVWNITGSLAPGASGTVKFQVRVQP